MYLLFPYLMVRDPGMKDLVLGAGRPPSWPFCFMQMSRSPRLLPIVPRTIAFRMVTILLFHRGIL